MNRIQFQHGMSLPEFLQRFGTEQQCVEAVMAERWPEGFRGPGCSSAAHCVINSRAMFQCNACRQQTFVTAGTMFAGTKLPLTTWFLAIYLISQAKTGLSALALKRHLGVSYPTAWLIHQKIMYAMAERDAKYTLGDVVQLDDAYLGGELSGGTAGGGSDDKGPLANLTRLKHDPEIVRACDLAASPTGLASERTTPRGLGNQKVMHGPSIAVKMGRQCAYRSAPGLGRRRRARRRNSRRLFTRQPGGWRSARCGGSRCSMACDAEGASPRAGLEPAPRDGWRARQAARLNGRTRDASIRIQLDDRPHIVGLLLREAIE